MKLEAVIVCKDYSDFLEHTLPLNVEHFDRLVVVTHPADKGTINLCNKYSVPCVQTVAMHENGDKFNKGRAINVGLGHLRGEDWLLHLDADIVLPHNFRNLLSRSHLNPENIYGADRCNVYGYETWQQFKHKREPGHLHGYFIEPPKEFPLGARIVHHEHGYTPIGYFQMWNKRSHKRYPINQGSAEHTDVLFAIQWARYQRVLLPEIIVYHLDSNDGPGKMGQNWNGRKTPWFGPKKKHPHHEHGHHPHHHHHKHPYQPNECGEWEIQETKK